MEVVQAGGTADTADGFWDLYSGVYDSVYELIPYRQLLRDAYLALELRDGMRLLDAGCGTGNFEHFVSQEAAPDIAIDALDFSPGMLAIARAKCASLPRASFGLADLSRPLPFDDASFDRIVSINVLYALPDADSTMRELVRVLKPGGVVVVSSPLPEFRVGPLVAEHLRCLRRLGPARRLTATARSLRVFVKSGIRQWALNDSVIDRREAEGRYHSLDLAGMHGLLERRRPDGLAEFSITPALAGQNLFARASKTARFAEAASSGTDMRGLLQ